MRSQGRGLRVAKPSPLPARASTTAAKRSWSSIDSMAVAVLLLTFWLRITNHAALGLGDPHYTATVRSMLVSVRNFLFIVGEPGGSIGVAKPPLGMWLQTLAAA